MAVDLALATITGDGNDANFPGVKLPTFAAAAWQRLLPDGMTPTQADRAITLKYSSRMNVTGSRRTWTQEIIDRDNDAREHLYEIQSLLVYYSRALQGMLLDSSLSIGALPPVFEYQWLYAGEGTDAKGRYQVAEWHTGDADPRAITSYQLVLNPDFVRPVFPSLSRGLRRLRFRYIGIHGR
jgi:hypothetical protein